jgi:hypothetical protein
MIPISTKAPALCFAFPDVCLVPAAPSPVPTPLPNLASTSDAIDTASSVVVENKEVLVESSSIPMSSGDEPGTGGGVVSGTFLGVVTFKTASAKVFAQGKRVVLLGAVTAHNGRSANMPAGQQITPSQGRVFAGS